MKKIDDKELKRLLKKENPNITKIAKHFNCARTSLYERIIYLGLRIKR